MSKKWTGQEFFLLGAAVCTLCLMYITILIPTSNNDTYLGGDIEDHQDNSQMVEIENNDTRVVNEADTKQEYAYRYQNGEGQNGDGK